MSTVMEIEIEIMLRIRSRFRKLYIVYLSFTCGRPDVWVGWSVVSF